jgi:uncharacterized cupin superfamily protein
MLYYGDVIYQLKSGDCIGFKPAEVIGHRLENETDEEASFWL